MQSITVACSRAMEHSHPPSAKARSSLDCLPEDVLFHIATLLEQSPADDAKYGRAQQLRNFTEVCKDWCAIGRAATTTFFVKTSDPTSNLSERKKTAKKMRERLRQLRELFPNANRLCFFEEGGQMKLDSLAVETRILQTIKHLEFRNSSHYCRAIDLPSFVWDCGNLETLSLSSGYVLRLQYLPKDVGNLTRLKRLDFRGHCVFLKSLPSSVGNWSMLTHIRLTTCHDLKELPEEVEFWINIEELSLRECYKLKKLPRGVKAWTRLETLELQGVYNFEALPSEVESWRSIRTLNLDRCATIKTFPLASREWTGLSSLEIPDSIPSGSGLQDPVEAWRNLTSIRISGSLEYDPTVKDCLTCLSQGVANWGKLRSATLQRCRSLRSLSEGVNAWVSLEEITLETCPKLRCLPDEVGMWSRLKKIEIVSCNALCCLPDSVSGWQRLENLKLSDCTLLSRLPDTVGAWTNLRSVKLYRCKSLRSLPTSVSSWGRLEALNLEDLPVEELPRGIGKITWPLLQRLRVCLCPRLPYWAFLRDWKHKQHSMWLGSLGNVVECIGDKSTDIRV